MGLRFANSHTYSVERRNNNYLLFILIILQLLIQLTLFTTDWRPDEYKSIQFFSNIIFQSPSITISQEIFMRVLLFTLNLSIVWFFYSLELIKGKTVAFALIWPMTIFLFSKIYWEFFVFPFYLVRHDLSKLSEILFIGFLLAVLSLTGEGNLIVLILFRLVLLGINFGYKLLAPLFIAISGVVINQFFNVMDFGGGNILVEALQRFQWTRDTVNPEYSIFETIGVFISSMHFFTLHTNFWILDFIFSICVLLVLVSQKEFKKNVKIFKYEILAVFSVILAATEVTHAFQNARYYYMFIPLLSVMTPFYLYPLIAALGILHVVFKLIEIFFV